MFNTNLLKCPSCIFSNQIICKKLSFFYLFLDQKNICFTKLFTKTRNAVTLRLRKGIQNWKCKYIKWNRLFLVPLVSWQGCINNPSLLLSTSKTNGRGWWGRCERKFVYSTWSERGIQDGGSKAISSRCETVTPDFTFFGEFLYSKSKPLLLTDLFDNNCCSYLLLHFKIRFNCFFDI